MLTVVLLVLLIALIWIGVSLGGVLRNTAIIAVQAAALRQIVGDEERMQRVNDIGLRLDDLTTVVAYWVAEKDSPLSGLYGEPDYALEKNRNALEATMLLRARSALKRLARA